MIALSCQVNAEASPDGAIVAACHCKRLGGVDSESPQFALTVTLHDEEGLVAVVDHHLEDLAVLRAHQDVISPPAHTAHGQPYQKHARAIQLR